MLHYSIILNVSKRVVKNKKIKPMRKITSAMFSYLILLELRLRIDKKESKLLVMKNIIAIAVSSSITVASFSFITLSEVSTIKQKPSRFEEVFNIWGDLSFLSFIVKMLGFILFLKVISIPCIAKPVQK